MGYPRSWMVDSGKFHEQLINMDDDWGYPYFRKPHIAGGNYMKPMINI